MIDVRQLTRTFESVRAVNEISFQVGEGEVLGFLGPNGAGKSTTMKMITGFLSPTSGTVTLYGQDIQEQAMAAKRLIGYLPEGAPTYGDMTPLEFLNFIAEIRRIPKQEKSSRIAYVIERLQLSGVMHQTIDTLSKGYKRRVGLAQAILHDPRVLILDEPTDGLDPNQKHEVRALIGALAKEKIIIISTHILEEVSAVCTRTVIIDHGKIIADCTPEALEKKSRYHQAVTITLAEPTDIMVDLRSIETVGDVEVTNKGFTYTAFPKPGQVIYPLVNEWVQTKALPIEELHVERGRLDDVFRQLTVGESA